MKVKQGIALYSIELDGCLNGVYTNEHEDGRIRNEIAVKTSSDNEDLIGTYEYTYFDGQERYIGLLEIRSLHSKTFTFEWRDESGNLVFSGTGYKMNEKQVAVRYESLL